MKGSNRFRRLLAGCLGVMFAGMMMLGGCGGSGNAGTAEKTAEKTEAEVKTEVTLAVEQETEETEVPGQAGAETEETEVPGRAGAEMEGTGAPGAAGAETEGTEVPGQAGAETEETEVLGQAGAETEETEVSGQAGAETEETGVPGQADAEMAEIDRRIADMSLREKILQMFMITPEALTGQRRVTAAGDLTKQAIETCPVGGIIYFSDNLENHEQLLAMLSNTRVFYKEMNAPEPFLAVDEEGGTVARIGNHPNFSVEKFGDMCDVGAGGNPAEAEKIGRSIGAYLSELGFNLDFAPVADVLTNPDNTVVAKRSFGSDPLLVADMAMAMAEGLQSQGVCAAVKHFPGHGSTAADTHQGYAYTDKTLDELMAADLIPFQAAAAENIPFIMAAHISVPSVIGDDTPCSLSRYMITSVLREQLGYQGIVITDAMNMGAISNQYSSEEAAVRAIEAGADMILMPADFQQALEGVMQTAENGEISEERIDESVKRILKVKMEMQ